ncbi:dead end protein homolog 1-like [Anopheles nili]|uniref:dead end protein homolog 1-like n=1 Tax=Anopheles nili TaxID=185578 RepID=UPI00237B4071|nr:dead end protein homolog 1-like [Anopheles nili]
MPIEWLGRTYQIQQINGQCICSLMNPQSNAEHAVEVFVNGIPRTYGADELIPILSKPGVIASMRILMEYDGLNRGIAYVKYLNPTDAEWAIKVLNGIPLSDTCALFLSTSQDYRSFWICNLFPTLSDDMIFWTVAKLTRSDSFSLNFNYLPTRRVKVTFSSHQELIPALNTVNNFRYLFGNSCFVKQEQTCCLNRPNSDTL